MDGTKLVSGSHDCTVKIFDVFSGQCVRTLNHKGKLSIVKIEPLHDKTNKMTCAPSEDSDQPGYLPSLIRVFTVHMKKHWALNYLLNAQ